MKKKKIVFFCLHFYPPIGGAERSMAEYFDIISENYEIKVYCFLDDLGRPFYRENTINKFGFDIIQSSIPIQFRIPRVIEEDKPDIIMTHLLRSEISIFEANKNNIPVIFFNHSLFEDICPHYLMPSCNFNDLLECYAPEKQCPNSQRLVNLKSKYNMCSKVVCNSEFSRKNMLKFFPEIEDKIEIIYPFINNIFCHRDKIKNDKKQVLYVNSMPLKGRDLAIKIANKNTDINFIFADVKEKDKNFMYGKNIKIRERISAEEMAKIYRNVDCVICPTVMQESFGMVVCESLLSGTPVVCTNKGYLPELMNQIQNSGEVLCSVDVDEWSESIKKCFDKKIEKDLSYEKFRDRYFYGNMMKKFIKIIENIF